MGRPVSGKEADLMNAVDVLHYGHQTVLRNIEDLDKHDWETPGVCGVWSVKDVVAHLASFEHLLVDVLSGFLGGGPLLYLDQFRDPNNRFNDSQVALREANSPGETLSEYVTVQQQVNDLIIQFSSEMLREPGTLPWYGTEYSLDDFIVYNYYGHKREHSAQIAVYRDHCAQA